MTKSLRLWLGWRAYFTAHRYSGELPWKYSALHITLGLVQSARKLDIGLGLTVRIPVGSA